MRRLVLDVSGYSDHIGLYSVDGLDMRRVGMKKPAPPPRDERITYVVGDTFLESCRNEFWEYLLRLSREEQYTVPRTGVRWCNLCPARKEGLYKGNMHKHVLDEHGEDLIRKAWALWRREGEYGRLLMSRSKTRRTNTPEVVPRASRSRRKSSTTTRE